MIQRKDGYGRVIFFYLSYDKPCGKLALGQNYIKIISDKFANPDRYWLLILSLRRRLLDIDQVSFLSSFFLPFSFCSVFLYLN